MHGCGPVYTVEARGKGPHFLLCTLLLRSERVLVREVARCGVSFQRGPASCHPRSVPDSLEHGAVLRSSASVLARCSLFRLGHRARKVCLARLDASEDVPLPLVDGRACPGFADALGIEPCEEGLNLGGKRMAEQSVLRATTVADTCY